MNFFFFDFFLNFFVYIYMTPRALVLSIDFTWGRNIDVSIFTQVEEKEGEYVGDWYERSSILTRISFSTANLSTILCIKIKI